MPSKDIKVIIETLLKDKGFQKSMKNMQAQTQKTTGAFSKFKGILAGIGVTLPGKIEPGVQQPAHPKNRRVASLSLLQPTGNF